MAFRWGKEVPDPVAPETFASAKIAWRWPEGSPEAGLRRLYRDLLGYRRTWPALRDREHTVARLLDESESILELKRGALPAIVTWANLTSSPQAISWPLPRGQQLLLSTAEPRYGGDRPQDGALRELRPYEAIVMGDSSLAVAP
jgi:maltooligosyltrehalose trehalohydrolase